MNLRIRFAPDLDDQPNAYYTRRYLVAIGRLFASPLTVTTQELTGPLAVPDAWVRRALGRVRSVLQAQSPATSAAVRMDLLP